MKKKIFTTTLILVLILSAFVYYYIALPAINIHSPNLWFFIITVMIVVLIAYMLLKMKQSNKTIVKWGVVSIGTVILIFAVGSLMSSPVFNSTKYQKMLNVEQRNFADDIKQISYNEIPILDKDSAQKLGSREMGSMVDIVSQFEVNNMYTQINYNQKPMRVTPLDYGSFVKWISNRKNGIPAYIKIDMTTQNVECVKLSNGIKYSFSEPMGRNVNRYLRFKYPTYIFDKINFEIDDNGTPYWICPVRDYTIGLFGGVTIGKVVLLNAITGETQVYSVKDTPKWVDNVYSAGLLISKYNYYGSLKHGYWNSVLGQKDCMRTTDGYNYIALEDDVWVYTGVTSVGGDLSNVGFALMNQRTMETRYYVVSGADEMSAMSSAEGQVQNLGYRATFPLLLNISNEPTYFLALKDNSGLVKKYAMVNVSKYQMVAIGDSVNECEKIYMSLLDDNEMSNIDENDISKLVGTITKISDVVIDGNSHYYIILDFRDEIFDVLVEKNIDIVKYSVGDTISIEYVKKGNINTVVSIE